ncbi:MAG: two-component system response regulator [Proteobacteria bacterium]|nr:MAG: two-component system response regulator [Pseudomonadota bacterium]
MNQRDTENMNVFVVEDALEVRTRLVALVNRVPGATVAGEAATVREAVEGVLRTNADTVLLDLQLKDGTGLEVLAQVKPQRPLVRVIVLTNFATPQHRQASRAAGADIFLDKSQEFGMIPGILQNWMAQEQAIQPTSGS